VRVLAPRSLRARVEATGAAWRAVPAGVEFDPTGGRAAEDQRAYVEEVFFGRELPYALLAEVAAGRPDALVVDSTRGAAGASPRRTSCAPS
jgi:hypothetical protein